MSRPRTASDLQGYYQWHAHIYDATRWTFLFGRGALIRMVAGRLRPLRILEIGCGTGKNLVELARVFPEARIVGLDLSADMIAKARKKVAGFGERVSLSERPYDGPVSGGEPFDLIVFSYCLTMINPGYDQVLLAAKEDLSPGGCIAVVDFHESGLSWFRRWMGMNHVRMEGQVLAAMQGAGLQLQHCEIRSAYGGVWRWVTCLAGRLER